MNIAGNDLGETRMPQIPFTHRMDNPVPPSGTQVGVPRYWETPVPFEGAKLVRLDLLFLSNKGVQPNASLLFDITLVDIHGEELHRAIPITLLAPIFTTKTLRGRWFRPFQWDPYKSFVRQTDPLSGAINLDVPFLAYFVK